MKKLLTLATLMLICTGVFAQYSENRYKAMLGVDVNGVFHENDNTVNINVETSHGYFMNDWFFAGGGLGIDLSRHAIKTGNKTKADVTTSIPLFADARIYLGDYVRPYLDFKAGYILGDVEGGFLKPAFGISFPIGNRAAINMGLSYRFLKKKVEGATDRINEHSIAINWGFEF